MTDNIDHMPEPKVRRSNTWWGRHTIYGPDHTKYMTRLWFGRLRLHIFYRGDADPDPHDHPWPFWTFPLTSYVEEVAMNPGSNVSPLRYYQVVKAFRPSYRPAEHTHRVLGRYAGHDECSDLEDYTGLYYQPAIDLDQKIVTLVWRGKECRQWGFWKHREGKSCWTLFSDYLFKGGKNAPCE